MTRFTIEGNLPATNLNDLANALRRAASADNVALVPGTSFKVKGVRVRVQEPQINDVRKWALAQGINVGKRGRISAELQAAYDAAN